MSVLLFVIHVIGIHIYLTQNFIVERFRIYLRHKILNLFYDCCSEREMGREKEREREIRSTNHEFEIGIQEKLKIFHERLNKQIKWTLHMLWRFHYTRILKLVNLFRKHNYYTFI